MRKGFMIAMAAVLGLMTASAQPAGNKDGKEASDQTVGLVLSGGGAKGIAHIGFIKALEDNDIPIDYVSGTSMGAIVGSLYATGRSPQEMMDLIRSRGFKEWSSGVIPPREMYRIVTPKKSSQWLGVNVSLQGNSSMTDILPTRLINPLPMSFAFMELYAPYTGECDCNFDSLMVPLRTVASDIYTHKSVVFSGGQLADAVRASMSFPLVFQPIKVNGTLLYDGGLYDVYPVNVMEKDFNPSRIIGVDVSTPNTHPQLNNLIGQLENMIMTGDGTPFPYNRGVNVKFDLSRFGLLAWNDADTIFNIGYRRGLEMIDSIRDKISARRPLSEVTARRKQYYDNRKPLVFSSVEIDGTSPQKAEYIRYLMTGDKSGNRLMPINEARTGFYNIASTGRLRNLVPHALYNDTTGLYRLKLDADVDNDFKLGVGGYLTSSAGSMLYASANYDPFALLRPWFELEGWAGQSYLAANARMGINFASRLPSHLELRATISREKLYETEKMFYDFSAPAFIKPSEFSTMLGYHIAAGRHAIAGIESGYGHLTTRYRSAWDSNPKLNGLNHLIQNLGTLGAFWSLQTFDDPVLPTSGVNIDLSAFGYIGNRRLKSWDTMTRNSSHIAYGDFTAKAVGYIKACDRFSLGISGEAFYSTRPLGPTYEASVVNAASFAPLASSTYLFDPTFRANRYLAAGLHPVYSATSLLQLRLDGYLFAPMQTIEQGEGTSARYSRWFADAQFLGEFSIALNLPFGAVRGYVDYRTSPAERWSGGISLGVLIQAPKFKR